ncbi:cadherin EGF LAG seven-pass G-type receptor 2-like [Amphiura filiformis]|uniref:cadherin EGF LAG seven-pass G-type receptor 2-like n=1 Tax=Amphiura filiformis TaxID=82378 RepID=UPI003B21E2F6
MEYLIQAKVFAFNKDGTTDGIVYSLTWSTGDGLTHFWVDSATGQIYARDTIDADITAEYTLSVVAQDVRFEPPRSASATVIITIIDSNDLCPEFDSPSYSGSMSPGDSFVLDLLGTDRLRLIAVDGDISGFIGVPRIESDTSNGGFSLVPTSTAGQWYIQVINPALVDLGDYTVVVSVIDDRGDQPCNEDRTDVFITVTDDFIPKFDKDFYDGKVPENSPPNYLIIQVTAKNRDGNSDGIVYRIQTGSNNYQDFFEIDPNTGNITVKAGADIDAELVGEFILIVDATDTTLEPPRTGSTTVSIIVGDINDQCPTFLISYYGGSMSIEDNYVQQTDGTDRLVLTAVDADSSGFTGTAGVDIDSTGGGFELVQAADPNKWNVRVADASRIVLGIHSLMVYVTDDTAVITCPRDLSNVTIAVTDDMVPVFDQDPYEATVPESSLPDFFIIQVSAKNKDGTSEGIVYRVKSGSYQGTRFFKIDPITGDITVRDGGIDAELVLEFVLFVEATDTRLSPQRSGITTVVITVGDINDQCPSFTEDMYTGTLEQGTSYVLGADGRFILRAEDGDQIYNGTINIESDSSGGKFQFLPASEDSMDNTMEWYMVTTDTSIDVDVYSIQVSVRDDNAFVIPPCAVETTDITVSVFPAHDIAPSFESDLYTGSVPEGAAVGTFIVQVTALNDEGTTDNILYLLKSASNGGENLFIVDSDDGEIKVNSDTIDRELVSEYTLFIEAQDTTTAPVLSDTTTVIVTITDINDNSPVFQKPGYDATLPEDAGIGFIVITVIATDDDENPDITYTIIDSNPSGAPFVISDPPEGIITVSGPLETDPPNGVGSYVITIRASDGKQIDIITLIITVTDVNDNGPVFDPKSMYTP